MKTYQNLKGTLILCVGALVWGFAFVAQATAELPPFLLSASRTLIGALALLLVLLLRRVLTKKPMFPPTGQRKRWLIVGLLCGVVLTVSINLQQLGISGYPEGVAVETRSGFLSSLYVVIVPLLAALLGERPSPIAVGAVAVAMVGIYLLCLSGGLHGIYLGDVWVLACAFSFSIHILLIARMGGGIDGILLSATQFAVCAVLSLIVSLFTEEFSVAALINAAPQLMYLGFLSCGVGYTMQIIGQRYASPTVASLTLSLEGVFAALGGWLISDNRLSPREWIGCALVFGAILLAQLPPLPKRRKSDQTNV